MQELIVSTLLYLVAVAIVLNHYQPQTSLAGNTQLTSNVPNAGTGKSKVKAKKETVALDSLTIRQLRVKAREVKIKNYSRMTKNQLLNLLTN